MSKELRPGIETLIREAGPEALGAEVKDFSASLSDLSESVKMNLRKERIAMMTTQDIPELLQDSVVEMNNVNRVATFLRQKLAAITELANLELARAGVVGRARGKAGAGATVSQGDEAGEAQMEMRHDVASEPAAVETVEDAEMVRSVYEALDKTVRGEKTPMAPNIRQSIAHAVIEVLKKEKAPKIASAVDPRLARMYVDSASSVRTDTELARTDPVASIQQQQNKVIPGASPVEVGDSRSGGTADMVQKILDQMRSMQDLDAKSDTSSMLGFGDLSLAPGVAATMASVLGAVNATSRSAGAPGMVTAKESRERRHSFLLTADALPAVARATQPSLRWHRTAAMNFF